MTHSASSLSALPSNDPLAIPGQPAGAAGSQAATWAPLVGALLLDLADVLSLGPQGVVIGLLVGTTLGWRIAAASGLSRKWRIASAIASAVYCIVPGTELVPLASVVTTAVRVRQMVSAVSAR